MTDIAVLSLKVKMDGADRAKIALDQLTASALGSGKATSALEGATASAEAAAKKAGTTHEAAAEALGGMIEPASLASGALDMLTNAVKAGIDVSYKYILAQDQVALSLSGIGAQTGATANMMSQLAEEHARAANISITAALEQEAVYIRAGISNTDVIGKLIDISKQYALVTGQDMPTANQELAESFSDPVKGVETMIDRVGGIDGETREYIVSLARANKMTEAQATMLGKVIPQIRGTEERVSHLTKLLDAGALAWKNYWEQQGKKFSMMFEPLGTPMSDRAVIDNYKKYKGRHTGAGGQGFNTAVSFEQSYFAFWREQERMDDARKRKEKDIKNTIDLAGDDALDALLPNDDRRKQLDGYLERVEADFAQHTMTPEDHKRAVVAYNRQVAELSGTYSAAARIRPVGEVARQTACKCANDEAKRAKAFEIFKQSDIEAEGPITQLAIDAKEVEAVLTDTMARIPSIVAPARRELSALGEDIAKSLGQAIASGQDLGDALSNTFRQIAASYVTQGIKDIFASMGNIGKTGSTGSASASGGGGNIWSTIFSGFSSLFSWDGGGYTGDGSRSGGVDGKGGFLAVMHPRETVIDHTKGGRGGGGQAVQVAVSVTVDDDGKIKAYVRDSSARAVQAGLSQYDAGMPRRVAAIGNDPRRR